MPDRRGRRRARALLAGLLTFAAWSAQDLHGQESVRELAERCSGGATGQIAEACREGALALQAGQGAVGLLAAEGAQIPGAASTLGRRFGGMPRLSLSVKGSTARVGGPDVEEALTTEGGSSFAFATQISLAAGLLDGFSVLPTVGGVLSVDAFATAGVLLLPDARGYQGGAGAFGLGASVGLLRESFTLPGVTVTVARRWLGEVTLGDRGAGDRVEVAFDPTVTSIRGVIGKDLLALGVLVGVGWDRYSGDASLRTSASTTDASDFVATRRLFFGGVSVNLLLLQLSAEGGWAGGFDPYPGRGDAEYDPESGSPYLSLAARLTL